MTNQDLVDAIVAGGRVHVEKGFYDLSEYGTLAPSCALTLVGEAPGLSHIAFDRLLLRGDSRLSDLMLTIRADGLVCDVAAGSLIEHCRLSGADNALCAAHVTGAADKDASYGVEWHDVLIQGFQRGFYVEANADSCTNGWEFRNVRLNANGIGAYLERVGYFKWYGGCINGSSVKGLYLDGTGSKIDGTHFERNGQQGNNLHVHVSAASGENLLEGCDAREGTIRDDSGKLLWANPIKWQNLYKPVALEQT